MNEYPGSSAVVPEDPSFTLFAPAEREEMDTIKKQRKKLLEHIPSQMIESYPSLVFFLNESRQMIHCNKALLDLLGHESAEDICGMRPGEALSCINSEMPGGCGTGEACRHCGAIKSIFGSFKNKIMNEECTLLARTEEGIKALNFSVHAVPLHIADDIFSIVYMEDISAQKNKEIMEQIFFHDLLNAVNGIVGASSLIVHDAGMDPKELAEMTLDRAYFIGREIKAHRMLMAAEKSELELEIGKVNTGKLLKEVSTMFSGSDIAKGKHITLNDNAACIMIRTDKRILQRILDNLVKNALEASEKGQSVVMDCKAGAETVLFSVKNSSYIPKDVQLRIFRRSFSTKGRGRGLGTYSVKMLTENYLGGKVAFTTDEADGTTFYFEIPRELK